MWLVPRRHRKSHSIDALCGTIASRRRRENDVHQEDRELELPRQAYAAHARLRRRHRVADDAAVVGIEHSNAMSKVHFDGRTREARIGIEGQRMRSFVANSLRPAAMALDPESRDEKIPDLLCQIAIAEGRMNADEPNRTVRATGAATSFSGLAKGRRYQGKLGRLIGEVFPNLLDQYHEASQKVSEREILEQIVQADLIDRRERLNEDDERIERRIRAAHKCLSLFYPTENGSSLHVPESQKDADDGVQRGKICEDSCVAFLIEHCPNTILRKRIVLSNIFVNARRDGQHRSQKYVFPKTPRTNSPPKPNSSGIVSTNYTGYGLCSEFDAIVVSSEILDSADGRCDGSTKAIIESVWEAKKTVSPARCTTCCRRNWPPSRPCWTTRMPNWCTATTTTAIVDRRRRRRGAEFHARHLRERAAAAGGRRRRHTNDRPVSRGVLGRSRGGPRPRSRVRS